MGKFNFSIYASIDRDNSTIVPWFGGANVFHPIYVLDEYESIIWVDRYNDVGSFELYAPISDELVKYCKPGYFVSFSESEHMMIIEDISIESNVAEGGKIKVIGRSAESILDRRVIYKKTRAKNNTKVTDILYKIIYDAFMDPGKKTNDLQSKRYVEEFHYDQHEYIRIRNDERLLREYGVSVDSSGIYSKIGSEVLDIPTIEATEFYNNENILDVVRSICQSKDLGFRILVDPDDTGYFRLYFEIYQGEKRTYDRRQQDVLAGYDYQQLLTPIVFSPSFDNLISSNYLYQSSEYKNNIVVSDGNIDNPCVQYVGEEDKTGIERRETSFQASVQQDEDMSRDAYKKVLKNNGLEELAKLKVKKEFDAECDTTEGAQFEYGRDFFIGDTVQIRNEWGIEEEAMITEFTWSIAGDGGINCYPTFKLLPETLVDNQTEEDDDDGIAIEIPYAPT